MGCAQHNTSLKATPHVQHGTAQRGTGLGLPQLAVMWITNSSMYNGLLVRITTFHPLMHIQLTILKDMINYRLYQ